MSDYLAWQQEDYYAILGVTRMATEEDIRKAFRQRAKECHPDRFPPDSIAHQKAADRFKELMVARDTLLDSALREAYDKEQQLIQQAYFDSVIFNIPEPSKSSKPRGPFMEKLKQAYNQIQTQDFYNEHDWTVGGGAESEEEGTKRTRGTPTHSRKSAASFYYAQGMRYASRGEYRRALYALNNARMLDPSLQLSEYLMAKIRHQAYHI